VDKLQKLADIAPAGDGGVLRGRVVFDGQPPAPQKLLVVKDATVCGKREHLDERLTVSKNGGIKNAVVYLSGVTGVKAMSALGGEFVLDQQACAYQPHVLLAPVNTPIQILNSDGILHNIHSFSAKNPPMNVAQPAFKKRMEISFSTPEAIAVKCDVHGWMGAWIFVVDHPYYALTDDEGNFTLTGIPPGTYTVYCWQEMLGEQSARVIVGAGETVQKFSYSSKK
jgi:plastocyanin